MENLIKLGFWPGTPNNTIHVFDMDFLEQWDLMQKRMPGVSERSFLKSLEDCSHEKGQVCIYRAADRNFGPLVNMQLWALNISFCIYIYFKFTGFWLINL